MSNLAAIRSGKTGKDCRGEEHEVELLWSIKSGKTRVLWNKQNISNLFREGHRSGMVDLAWKTNSDHTIQIVAHSTTLPGVEHQYDLVVDGRSFFDLSTLADVGKGLVRDDGVGQSSEASLGSRGSALSSLGSRDPVEEYPPAAMDYRLSMAGLSSSGLEVVDELHSDLYSSALETVRSQIVECLPQIEGLVSRAIMDAFIADCDSLSTCSSLSDSPLDMEVNQIELAALLEAFEWTRLNIGCAKRQDAKEQALEVMQKQITATFVRIRNEELPSHIATRMLLSVAALLRLEFASSIPKDTLILFGLAASTTTDDLKSILSKFGTVVSAAVTRRCTGFAFCRFLSEESPRRMQDALNARQLCIEGMKPNMLIISETMGRDISTQCFDAEYETRQDIESLPRLNSLRYVMSDRRSKGVSTMDCSNSSEGARSDSVRSLHSLERVDKWSGDQQASPNCVTTALVNTAGKIPLNIFSPSDEYGCR